MCSACTVRSRAQYALARYMRAHVRSITWPWSPPWSPVPWNMSSAASCPARRMASAKRSCCAAGTTVSLLAPMISTGGSDTSRRCASDSGDTAAAASSSPSTSAGSSPPSRCPEKQEDVGHGDRALGRRVDPAAPRGRAALRQELTRVERDHRVAHERGARQLGARRRRCARPQPRAQREREAATRRVPHHQDALGVDAQPDCMGLEPLVGRPRVGDAAGDAVAVAPIGEAVARREADEAVGRQPA
eukprot:scaffold96069_cov72-Phaeocystis_antarctica.AAC.2